MLSKTAEYAIRLIVSLAEAPTAPVPCQVCNGDVVWEEAEIHHVEAHTDGGRTTLDNGVLVHRDCHPKGEKAAEFAKQWKTKRDAAREQRN